MVGIYEIVNNINGKVYVGQSVNIQKRWKAHKYSDKEYPLYKAFRKYGIENFSFNILEETLVSELTDREIYWIKEKDSFNFGYNQTPGGEGGALNSITWDEVEEATELLRNSDLNQSEIAREFNISSEMINGMNTGRFYRRDIEYPIRDYSKDYKSGANIKHYCLDCKKEITRQSVRCVECSSLHSRKVKERPTKEWLIENIATRGFADVGREFSVSPSTIRRWCSSYEIPDTINEMKKLYGNYVEKTKPTRATDIEVVYNDKEYLFKNTSEMADFIISSGISKVKRESILAGCARLAKGTRQSYIGFKLKTPK